MIVIANHKGKENPGIGIIWQLKIERDKEIKIPPDSEIKEIAWWSGSMPLMDEANPAERLWGGVYTAEALRSFDMISYKGFGGIVQIDSWYPGITQYERLKQQEQKANV